jgi:hypothetical protein
LLQKDRDLPFWHAIATVQTAALPKKFRNCTNYWEGPREGVIAAEREVKALVHANLRSGSRFQ